MSSTAPGLPAISVVIPLYDGAATIARALASVLSQTMTRFEVVVVNDGSTDLGPEWVRALADPRIRVVDQPNRGVAAARNAGIAEARADLIAFLDADDEWEPEFLQTILDLWRAWPRAGAYATSYWIRSAERKRRAIVNGLPHGFERGLLGDYFSIAARSDPPIWTSAVCVSRRAITTVGGFLEGVSSGEDLLAWARLAARYDLAYCAMPKAHFWEPLRLSDRPGRVPQHPDAVAAGLQTLLREGEPTRTLGLTSYLGLWHRMRAVIYLQLGDHRSARREIRQAISCGRSVKLFTLYALTLFPAVLSRGAFRARQHLRRALLP